MAVFSAETAILPLTCPPILSISLIQTVGSNEETTVIGTQYPIRMLLSVATELSVSILVVAFAIAIAKTYDTRRSLNAGKTRSFDWGKLLKKRLDGWWFLLAGPSIIQRSYDAAKTKPFEICVPGTRLVFVSEPSHIKEVDSASDKILSLHAATKTVCTM